MDTVTLEQAKQFGNLYSTHRSYAGLRPTGALADSFPRLFANTDIAAVSSGQLRLCAIWLPAGLPVTTISFLSNTTALSAGTNQWFSLWSPALARLGVTNDDTSTAWGTTAVKTLTLASQYIVPTSGVYYLGCTVVASTVPTLRGTAMGVAAAQVAPILAGSSTTSLTNPASAPTTAGALAASGNYPYCWVG